jgi:SAM-dependent methyltransferase
VDGVLLLGPLYHLTCRDDRLQALREAYRVVRPGGVIAAAAISRFASTYDGLLRGFLEDSRFEEIVERDVREGQHRNPTGRPEWFTTAYFHHPEELRDEVIEVGFRGAQAPDVIPGRSSWSAQGADAVCCNMAGTTTSQRARGGTSWPTRSRASSRAPGISFASATALP